MLRYNSLKIYSNNSKVAFIIAFFIAANYMFRIVNPAIYLIVIMVLLCGARTGSVKFSWQALLMIPFVFSVTIGGIFSPAGYSGIVYMITTWFLFLMLLRSRVDCTWVEKFPKYLMIFTAIQTFFVLLYPFAPHVVQYMAKVVLTPAGYADNTFQWNSYRIDCGITSVQSLAAFYVTIFLSLAYAYLSNMDKKNKNRIIFLVLYVLAFVALLYTSKRGVMLANIAALLVIPLLLDKKASKKIRYFLVMAIFAVAGYGFLAQYFPQAIRIFTRFQTQKDISTGRFDIYKKLLSNVKNDWLIGKGNLSAALMLDGNFGHNIYIQLFYENGIIGCASFLLLSISTFVKTMKDYRSATKANTKIYLLTSFYYQVYFLFYGLFGNPLFDYTIYFTYIVMIIVGMYGEWLLKYEALEENAR